ncbi:MAG: TetR/AcrR family transcriptional regulator [Rhodoglobus sp.]
MAEQSGNVDASRARQRNPPGQGARLRDDIVESAVRLLARGIAPAALSLRAVAREAQITAPAIYPHFAGIDELLVAVVARRFSEFSAALTEAVDALPQPHTHRDELSARCRAYLRFGLARWREYELLFSRGDAYGDMAYEDSAGEIAFNQLARSIAAVRPDADSVAIASVLWPALHGLVLARLELTGFPWLPVEDQIDQIIEGLVIRAPSRSGE